VPRKGSQYWIRRAVNEHHEEFGRQIANCVGNSVLCPIKWVSPLGPTYRELRDREALSQLNIRTLPQRSLENFWPRRGPVWDALGRTNDGSLLLVEAKAHIGELASPRSKAGAKSAEQIAATMSEVRGFLAPRSNSNWSNVFYQYANRLAALYLLRHLNGLKAHLVFVYFLNADEMKGPGTKNEWEAALRMLYAALELPRRNKLTSFIHNCFVDVTALR
jgi:hypothetical protein